MSKTKNRETAPEGGSVEHRLARLLDSTPLEKVVPHLAPETLHQLIRYRGLEACGDVITSATRAQLTSLLDLDLWRHQQPGRDEQFDVDRFGEWLETLAELGDAAAARTIASLDTQVVITGLSRYLRVFDPGVFEPTFSSDDELIDREALMNSEASGDELECELGGYLLRARRTDSWHAILAVLGALETEHAGHFHIVMQGCRDLSNSAPEIDGLDDLLTMPEQQMYDAAAERERRRSRLGYAAPADARAFLQMARRAPHSPTSSSSSAPTVSNPVAAAYFRATEEEAQSDEAVSAEDADAVPASVDAVIELLAEAGVMPEQPRALLSAGEDERESPLPLLRRLMESVLHCDKTAYLSRGRELGFLANALIAGCSVQSRPFTPQEAADAVASACNLGLESWQGKGSLPDTFLVDHDLVAMFEAGWSVLYEDVSLFVADQLLAILAEFRSLDADIDRDLRALHRRLTTERKAGTPWLAREAADVLATLDTTAWISVLGLLDECPILPAAFTAVVERRKTPVSPTAFQFISTTAQLGDVRDFMRALPRVLSS
jgi:hypothetical protein